VFLEQPPGLDDRHRSPETIEQTDVELSFEFQHVLGKGGLAHV
jgi:hypothetical protein